LTALGTDLIAWWDADPKYWGSKGNITVSTGVSSWKDIVAGYDATQGTGSAQPAYSSSSFGGSYGVSPDGIDDCLTCTDAALLAALPSGSAGGELWCVIQQDLPGSTAGATAALGYGGASSAVARRLGRNSVGGVNRGNVNIGDGAVANSLNGANVTLSTRHVMRAVFSPTATNLYVDGTLDATLSVVPSTTNSRWRMFAATLASTSQFWQGAGCLFMATALLSTNKAAGLHSFCLQRRRL
jgi:hypothetical protein